MRLLLDTHAVAWWWLEDPQLPAPTFEVIADEANQVFVSPASAWEIATKHRIGKWPEAKPIVDRFDDLMTRASFEPIPITVGHARLAGALKGDHGDPFDRMLIAQAMQEQLVIVTRDSAFDQFGVLTMWNDEL